MELGPEDNGIGRIRQKVYLITFARVLAQTALANPRLKDPSTMNRQTIMNVVRDAVDHPMLGSGGGRPADREASPVEKIVVFREAPRWILPFPCGAAVVCCVGLRDCETGAPRDLP